MLKKRFILLVIDGLGVGEMPDVKTTRPKDIGSHTLKNVINFNQKIRIPNLRSLNLVEYFINNNFRKNTYRQWQRSLGKFLLAHFGADSFMGHQEIVGSQPKKPLQQFVNDKKDDIISVLKNNGITAQYNHGIILINNNIAITDNIESDYGFNINVVGSLDHNGFEEILFIGKIVRQVVKVGRVITMGGKGISKAKLLSCIEHKHINEKRVNGINIPKLNIYNGKYRVVHLGYNVSRYNQAPQILTRNGYPVILIGKAADVISADNAGYFPAVHTKEVINCLLNNINKIDCGLIFANIQETDLAGHSQNVIQYSHHLELVDCVLPQILDRLGEDDVFIITSDHGNDPTIGHSFHTRELTPLILFSKKIVSQDFGTRKTLADIGASICHYFSLGSTEYGCSFIS